MSLLSFMQSHSHKPTQNAFRLIITLSFSITVSAQVSQPSEESSAPITSSNLIQDLLIATYAPHTDDMVLTNFIETNFSSTYPDADLSPTIYRTNTVLAALAQGLADIGLSYDKWLDKEMALLTSQSETSPLTMVLSAEAIEIIRHPDANIQRATMADIQNWIARSSQCEQKTESVTSSSKLSQFYEDI